MDAEGQLAAEGARGHDRQGRVLVRDLRVPLDLGQPLGAHLGARRHARAAHQLHQGRPLLLGAAFLAELAQVRDPRA